MGEFKGTEDKCKERVLFQMLENLEEDIDGIGVHLIENMYPDFKYKVYLKDGYCFDVHKEHQCEPDEIYDHDIHELQEDGCTYSFYSGWDGFKEINCAGAIILIKKAVEDE